MLRLRRDPHPGHDLAPPPGALMVGIADRPPRVRWAFGIITLFFTVWPLVALFGHPLQPIAVVLVLAGWAVFGVVLLQLFRFSPFGRAEDFAVLAPAVTAITVIAFVLVALLGVDDGVALFYYAGVSSARLVPNGWAYRAIAVISLVAAASLAIRDADPTAGLVAGFTVGTISVTLATLSALARANRDLQAARHELAEAAVTEERARIARDLHDTLGHSLSVIALKSELARRILPDDPARAAEEIGDVERTARDALASVRETVSGYRQPTLAMELAGAREALRAAGIAGIVEPAPERLPRDIDALLGWAVREGVTNVLRHSEAHTASIRVTEGEGRRVLEITDDGRGGSATVDDLMASGGSGLAGLRERAKLLGGAIDAGAVPGQGFRLRVTVPIKEAAP
jgi:two-component system, NarL family, sensor histidine kinase DesK